MKRWIVRKPEKEYSERIVKESGVTGLCGDVLASRGKKISLLPPQIIPSPALWILFS